MKKHALSPSSRVEGKNRVNDDAKGRELGGQLFLGGLERQILHNDAHRTAEKERERRKTIRMRYKHKQSNSQEEQKEREERRKKKKSDFRAKCFDFIASHLQSENTKNEGKKKKKKKKRKQEKESKKRKTLHRCLGR